MYRYTVDEPARLVVATFEGEVTDSDLFDYLAHMLGHTGYRAGWRSLIDLSTADSMMLTSAGMQRMRALPLFMEERLSGARAAVLAPEGSEAMRLAQLYRDLGAAAAYRIDVFSDRESAMRWLLSEETGSAGSAGVPKA